MSLWVAVLWLAVSTAFALHQVYDYCWGITRQQIRATDEWLARMRVLREKHGR